MNNKDYILALIKLADNNIIGRIKFQKLIYILKNHGVEFNDKFSYHHYGPYSADLQLEIEELVYQGIVEEYGSNPFIYKINENNIDEVDENILKEKEDLINYLNNQDYRDLELISTIYYLKQTQYKDSKAIKNKLKILKPNIAFKIESAYKSYEIIQNTYN